MPGIGQSIETKSVGGRLGPGVGSVGRKGNRLCNWVCVLRGEENVLNAIVLMVAPSVNILKTLQLHTLNR